MDSNFDVMLMPKSIGEKPLHFVWSPKAGMIGKDTVAEIGPKIEEQLAYGWVSIEPSPASIEFRAPLTDAGQMVAFLANLYHLPPELMALYPALPSAPEEEDAESGFVF
jgi:hypothetical protein